MAGSGSPHTDDNRIRTHLANERTFLAWFRTALTLVALGVAVANFLSDDRVLGVPTNEAFALALIVAGGTLSLLGWSRHRTVAHEIERNSYRPDATSESWATVVLVGLAILACALVLTTGHP